MDIRGETEKIKLKFLWAYEQLCKKGVITEDELEEIMDILDQVEQLSPEELARRLGKFQQRAGGISQVP